MKPDIVRSIYPIQVPNIPAVKLISVGLCVIRLLTLPVLLYANFPIRCALFSGAGLWTCRGAMLNGAALRVLVADDNYKVPNVRWLLIWIPNQLTREKRLAVSMPLKCKGCRPKG